ncbi:E3 ubiquitin-protein ligase UPL3 [Vitis vinifera]|uniref:E3 ubiquitin-protein ligase UPL3 n=1 Tax=Vitis vinifera TaxID=29760 RepID=A0A438IJ34_VITVI|nr:E3 ubiquitin-protein ligase UPL3 [Vitis vinifera]
MARRGEVAHRRAFREPCTYLKDEELDISPVEIDDALVIEDDDISDDEDDDHDDVLRDDSLPVCMPDKVHDVKLGDSAEDSNNAPATSDSQTNAASGSSSRAAAVKGLASANGRGIRGGRDRHGRPLFGSSDPPRLIFSAGGKQLNRHLTIYQAIQRQLVLDEDDDERYNGSDFISSDGSRLWSDIYTITYQRADAQADRALVGGSSSATQSRSTRAGSGSSSNTDMSLHRMSLLDSILQGELPFQAVSDDFSEGKISCLDELSATGARVPYEEFINSKLTPKLARQIQDALALCSGSLPSWCYQVTKACPFLFPFETRRQYFYSTAFGLSRALYRLQQQQGADGHGSTNERIGRLQRQKVRVSRNRILDSAAKVMEMYSSQKAVLEVEYFGEVGTGLGPTLEFYTLLSHDLQKVGLGMWRSNFSPDKQSMEIDGDELKNGKTDNISRLSPAASDIVQAPLGLFPRPWPPNADASDGSQFSKVIEHFRLVGRVIAKALQDGRLLDLPLSTALYKLVLGQILQELQVLVSRKQYLESTGGDNQDAIANLCFRGAPIEDLWSGFHSSWLSRLHLKPGEENVDINNLEEYISLVVDATVKTGLCGKWKHLDQVFDITSLQIFSPDELDYLLCGRRELWEAETLVDHIKFDHGYTAKSPAIINLLEIMENSTQSSSGPSASSSLAHLDCHLVVWQC